MHMAVVYTVISTFSGGFIAFLRCDEISLFYIPLHAAYVIISTLLVNKIQMLLFNHMQILKRHRLKNVVAQTQPFRIKC